ncbi:hypothetical protein FQN50_009225 [Emmonsiellopsis sp. PD_5]|nr:hypothetical protein FQN50_009225 [Emmonsiellopsis sp. PD_5]
MDSPLSVLTPSKRNARPPFAHAHSGANTPRMPGSPAIKTASSLLDDYASTTPMRSPIFNDENARPGMYKGSTGGLREFEGGREVGGGEDSVMSGGDGDGDGDVDVHIDVDDDVDVRVEEGDVVGEGEGPMSSPFQTTVLSERAVFFGSLNNVDGSRGEEPREEKLDCRELMDDDHVVDYREEKVEDEEGVVMEDKHAEQDLPTIREDVVEDSNAAPHEQQREERDVDVDNDHRPAYETEENSGMMDTHLHANRNNFGEVSNITMNDKNNESMSTIYHDAGGDNGGVSDAEGPNEHHFSYDQDDTCLSSFSAVPNADMTLFAQLRRDSPIKRMREGSSSPRKTMRTSTYTDDILETPNTVKQHHRRAMFSDHDGNTPTPGRRYPRGDSLLDFTDPINAFSRASQAYASSQGGFISPSRRQRFSPAKSTADRFRSPAKISLLDLDMSPAPTPRSIPTITPRELESLKSSFLSQISSLKATLSGRDAEVASLKEAVSDAERRVGEALEELRNESARKETEQREWERRGKEMETVLRGVRAEIVDGEHERERLSRKVEEGERCKEKLEGRVVELESQLSAARNAANNSHASPPENTKSAEETAKEVQDAVEKVARELHTLYKGKHETKVAALKKSYEARWEKRVREAERKLKEALEENDRLRTERDAGSFVCGEATFIRETESLEADKRVLEARVKGLEQEMASVKRDSEILRSELKQERSEKGELVAAVDEWLAIQQHQQQQQQPSQEREEERGYMHEEQGHHHHHHHHPQQQEPREHPQKRKLPEPPVLSRHRSPSEPNEFPRYNDQQINENTIPPPSSSNSNYASGNTSNNISRVPPPSSAIRPRAAPPTTTTTNGPTPRVARFGMPSSSAHSRGNSGGSGKGLAAPSGLPAASGRSGIMSSIERMGRGGGA